MEAKDGRIFSYRFVGDQETHTTFQKFGVIEFLFIY